MYKKLTTTGTIREIEYNHNRNLWHLKQNADYINSSRESMMTPMSKHLTAPIIWFVFGVFATAALIPLISTAGINTHGNWAIATIWGTGSIITIAAIAAVTAHSTKMNATRDTEQYLSDRTEIRTRIEESGAALRNAESTETN
jgi:hypothetical protein